MSAERKERVREDSGDWLIKVIRLRRPVRLGALFYIAVYTKNQMLLFLNVKRYFKEMYLTGIQKIS